MTFEQDYAKLLLFANNNAKAKKLRCTGLDLLTEAYIKLYDSKKQYSLKEFKNLIIKESFNEQDYQIANDNTEFKRTQILSSSYCISCDSHKPISAFTLSRFLSPKSLCKKCYRKKYKKAFARAKKNWMNKNRENWNTYMRNRRAPFLKNKKPKPIKQLWREANRRYQTKQKENLTDVYIKSLLHNDKSPVAIANKRNELLQKRLLP